MVNKSFFMTSVRKLIKMHSEGLLGGEEMPEDVLIDIIPKHELPNVLTLEMALNYQRNSYMLWKSIAQAYQDEETRWIFNVKKASECQIEDLRHALLFHRVALQPNKHPEIWKRVSEGIYHSSERGDVYGLMESVQFDIAELKNMMQITRKSEFPYLSGPKIFNYWLYVIEMYSNFSWKSRELITIAPDTHILKATVKLGLCSEEVLSGTSKERQIVAEAWEEALSGSGLAPIDVHTPLWLWSRAGFPSLVY